MNEKAKKVFMLIMIACCFIVCYKRSIYAATVSKTILETQYGTITGTESKTFKIEVPEEARINILFKGYQDDDDIDEIYGVSGTYGDYNLYILNANGDSVYQNSDYILYDDKTLSMDLGAGVYTIVINTPDRYMGFDYIFAVTAQYKDRSLNKSSSNMFIGEQLQL